MPKKLDKCLIAVLIVILGIHYARILPQGADRTILFSFSIVATIPVLFGAFASLKDRKISVALLASIALVVSVLAREWASAAFINLMLSSARLFGYYTDDKARAAIESLLKLRPEIVKIKKGNRIISVPVARVAVGDLVIVESGDRLAVDGVVEEGGASIDQSSLTGESVPVGKARGDEVYSSTLAVSGSLIVVAVKVGKDTTLEKIIALVESSESEKPIMQTAAETFASWYVGITIIASVSIYVLFRDLNLLLSLLLVACADDIAVGIPLAFMAAIGYAGRRGVIIKGGSYLEGLTKVKTVVLDKTGTITKGKLAVAGVTPLNDFSKQDVLRFAGISESVSGHPIARAIIRYAADAKISFAGPDKFEEFPGKGILAEYKGKEIVAGKEMFLKERGIRISKEGADLIEKAQDDGYTATVIAYGNKVVGFVSSADEVRPQARGAIYRMKAMGVRKIIMLTGDNEKVAKKISNEVGVTEYHASLLPRDKLAYIKQNLDPKDKLMMIGDGVNDAAALALADIGIAMGAIGSDAAIEASNIALMKDDLMEIPEMLDLGRYTKKICRQDFWIWGVTNAVGVFLVLARIIGPEGSAAFNFITDFFPLINSLRLFNLHLKIGTKS